MTMEASSVTSMSAVERRYFEQVRNQCDDDVRNICGNMMNFPAPALSFPSPPLDLMMNDFGNMVDDLMRQFNEDPQPGHHDPFSAQPPSIPFQAASTRGLESPVDDKTMEMNEGPVIIISSSFSPCEEEFVRHMLSQFVPMIPPDNSPELAQKISEHGHFLLQSIPKDHDETSPETRIARRLSEVTPEDVMEHRRTMFLPFRTDQNDCLVQAYRTHRVGTSCGQALQDLEHVRTAQYVADVNQRRVAMDTCLNLFVLYFLVLALVVTVYMRRMNLLKVKRRLVSSIFRTVYAKPELKRAVEEELGHSIGRNAPRPWKAMKQGFRKLHMLFCMLSLLSIVGMTGFVSFSTILHISVTLAAFMLIREVFLNSSNRSCCCCCCNASPEDAATGNLTVEQACCKCCKGTGSCCTDCPCCSDSSSLAKGCGCCCCCKATPEDAAAGNLTVEQACCKCCKGKGSCCTDCPCCSGSSSLAKGCCCCCCKATPEDAAAGNLTVEQACCKCCKGTGSCCSGCPCCSGSPSLTKGCCCCCDKCSCTGNCSSYNSSGSNSQGCGCCDKCCCCCGSGGRDGSSNKAQVLARYQIYEGVPLQIV